MNEKSAAISAMRIEAAALAIQRALRRGDIQLARTLAITAAHDALSVDATLRKQETDGELAELYRHAAGDAMKRLLKAELVGREALAHGDKCLAPWLCAGKGYCLHKPDCLIDSQSNMS